MPGSTRRKLTVGLPRLHHELGERRDFLPSLVAFLDRLGVGEIVLEAGYGSGVGAAAADYLSPSPVARFSDEADCFRQDLVALLRCPTESRLRLMKPGALLLAMLHLESRPARVRLLRELELQAISLDMVRDDLGRRLVENLESVAANGVRQAFRRLLRGAPHLVERGRPPVRMTVLGAGAVGALAARAGVRYGDGTLRAELNQLAAPGVEVTLLDAELTRDAPYLRSRVASTDLLVDATRRPTQSEVLVPNAWLADLPDHAVILDLCADPYDFSFSPPHRKAIEGVPQGDLDQFIFERDDPAFDRLDPHVARTERRATLSCYSWPGIEPRQCMEVYSRQVEPVFRAAIDVGVRQLDPLHGTWAERATARACLSRWQAAT